MSSYENHLKNREILQKLNKNSLEICNVLNALSKKVDRLSNDLESVKSYINQLEEQKKLKLEAEKSGWWFS
jgi:regulator of replication initiation timing